MNGKSILFEFNSLLPDKSLSTFNLFRFFVWRIITLYPLALTSFKARDVTLKYAWFLIICILALDRERAVFIVWTFEYAQCVGGSPVQLKPISRVISWYAVFVSYKYMVWIIYMSIRVTMSKMHKNANIGEKSCLSYAFEFNPEMAFF